MTATPIILVNGAWTDACPAQDRGLLYGDGVFRTLRLNDGAPVWWEDHLAKLTADCGRLAMPAPAAEDWRADLASLAARRPEASVRLTVTRGGGERGYRPPPHPEVMRIAMAYPAVLPDPDLAAAGIAVRLCNLRLGLQPRLAGVKHLNRLENVLARMEWDDPEIQEGLLLDQQGRLVSGVSSNLFLHAGGRLQTPRLDRCGVAGVARARLLHAAPGLGLQVEERDLTVADLLAADAVFLCNSLTGLRWVRCLGERVWPRSPRFDALQDCLSA